MRISLQQLERLSISEKGEIVVELDLEKKGREGVVA